MASYELKSIFAPLPVTKRGQGFHLNADPKNEKFVYCSGPSVIIRDLQNPLDCYMYNEHTADPTAACFAPSGYYIASGDAHGKVRVWDTTQETHILKYECSALGGIVRDIAWSPDSKRIICGGEGRSKRAHCFLWDSGSSCGALSGHSKTVNAVAHKSIRPFRAVTVGEDYQVLFFSGVPYKYEKTCNLHDNFVNSVRFDPLGATFCTVSSDKRVGLFDGKTGELLGQFEEPGASYAHKGGVMACCYNGNGTRIMTASADKTVKVWDVETQKVVNKFEMGSSIDDQQLGCLWAGPYMLSLSLSGEIHYLDTASGQVTNTIKGHQRSISALATSGDKVISGDASGRMVSWESESGKADYFSGSTHQNKIHDIRIAGDTIISTGIEDRIQRTQLGTLKTEENIIGLENTANCFDVHQGLEVYTCQNERLVLVRGGNEIGSQRVNYQPFGVALNPDGATVAVGAQEAPIIYLYVIENDTLVEFQTVDAPSPPTELCFSADGAWLAAGCAGRHIILIDVNNSFKPVTNVWTSNSRVTTASFSPNSQYLAVAGIDSNILVCEVNKPMKSPLKILRAHPQSTLSRVRWSSNNVLVSVGSDAQVRSWTINME